MAESRCNTLKGQVNYMKMLYNGMSGGEGGDAKEPRPAIKQRHLSVETSATETRSKRRRHERRKPKESGALKPPDEEPSRDFATEKSIHNIITGITRSVNRLSQLQLQIERSPTDVAEASAAGSKARKKVGHSVASGPSPEGVQNIQCAPRSNVRNTTPEKPYQPHVSNEGEEGQPPPPAREPEPPSKKNELQKRSRSEMGRVNRNKNTSGISISELKKRLKGNVTDKRMKLTPMTLASEYNKLKKKVPAFQRKSKGLVSIL